MMCGCEATFVCSRCAGDLKQDWRMAFEPGPQELDDDRRRRADVLEPKPEPGLTR